MDKKLFSKVEKEVGFGKAVVILEKEIPDEFYKSLDFEQLLDITKAAFSGSDLRAKSLKLLMNKAEEKDDYKSWDATLIFSFFDKDKEIYILEQKSRTATNLDQLYSTANDTKTYPDLNKKVWKRIDNYVADLK